MEERLNGYSLALDTPSLPVFAPDFKRTAMIPEGISIEEWNQNNIHELIAMQQATQEGCFFVGLCMLARAFYPERPLPEAHSFWDQIRMRYGTVLEKERLLVPPNMLGTASEICNEWGIDMVRAITNVSADEMMGTGLDDRPIVRIRTHNKRPVTVDRVQAPFSTIVMQPGASTTHFITVDGSNESAKMSEEYEATGFYPIMVLEFASLAGV